MRNEDPLRYCAVIVRSLSIKLGASSIADSWGLWVMYKSRLVITLKVNVFLYPVFFGKAVYVSFS